MKFEYLVKIFLVLLVLNSLLVSQDDNRIIAKIGSTEITVEDFRNRFDFMPHLNYSSTYIDSIKKEFLYSLIAEKLWALQADENEMDTLETVNLSILSLEKLFVKDELYKNEIESKINISSKDIAKGLSQLTRILSLKVITTTDSSKINTIYTNLLTGLNFDSTITKMNLSQKPIEVKFGSLEDEYLEDILFDLKLNELTKPLKIKENWFLFKLVNDEKDNSIDLTKDYARNIVIKKLKDRKSEYFGRDYLNNLFGAKSITADGKLFDIFCNNLKSVLEKRTGKTDIDSLVDIQLTEADLLQVYKITDLSSLNSTFIQIENNHLNLKDFIFYLIYQKINFNTLVKKSFDKVISRIVKKFIEDEVIANEGFKLGLQNQAEVKKDLSIWKNYYLSELLLNSYADSIKVSNEEVIQYNSTNTNIINSGIQVNILEILVDNLDDIGKILSELNSGKDFKELAAKYNKREWTKKSEGEWGFFDVNGAGEIGRVASKLTVGEVYGPLKVPEGYSILKLIEKKKNVNRYDNIISENDENLTRIKLALSKMDKLINSKTISLANKYGITINEQLLHNVQTSELNTFTYRLIGFGGKIAAYPITIPMFEWYKEYKSQNNIP